MPEIQIEQAIWVSASRGFRLLGRSAGFPDEWLADGEELCAAFGDRLPGVDCPACVFAQPFGKRHVAVVQVADQGADTSNRAGLGFRQLIFRRRDYPLMAGDPFALAARFPPPWNSGGNLPTLSTDPLSAARTVDDVQKVLKQPEGPALLGGVQALLDGGRLVFQRPAPDTALLQNLWTLLPTSSRCELWPASFAFDNTLPFDALVVSRPTGEAYADYLTEDQAAEYPQGRYELSLQQAAEAGDQAELDALFARRSRAQTWRLGWLLLAAMLALLVIMSVLNSLARR
jgi:hypothetical protein